MKNFSICDDLDVCLSQLGHNSKLAVAVSREHSRNSRLIASSQFYCFENTQIIHKYALRFLIRNNFPNLNELNQFIQMSSASGIIEKWRSMSEIQIPYKNYELHYVEMNLENCAGCFVLFFLVYVVVIPLVVFERIVHKKVQSLNVSKVWLIIDMLIDPHRHFWRENCCFWK